MKKETAEKARKMVEDIEHLQRQINSFERTKEFCKIVIYGEDGNENKSEFSIKDKHRVAEIRAFIIDMLKREMLELHSKLEQL